MLYSELFPIYKTYTNKYSGSWNDKTRMETSTKAKLDKSEGQI